jgi:CheY-like chemotaxis protein
MKQIIKWLITIEDLAYSMYCEAARLFEQDEAFAAFLRHLAEDEARHSDLMGSAEAYLRGNDMVVPSAIIFDQAARDRVQAPLEQTLDLIREGTVTKKQMISLLVAAEFSELNDIFMYVTETLKGHSMTFQHGAAVIQSHQDRVRRFVAGLPEALRPADSIQELPVVWERRYLVVDDSEPVRDLLCRYLSREGTVEAATCGEEGLEKLRARYFDAIIADIEMPVMDGLALYRQAVALDPQIGQRFLFCSGFLSYERELFLQENGLPCLIKPFRLTQVGQQIQAIMERTAQRPPGSSVAGQEERRG